MAVILNVDKICTYFMFSEYRQAIDDKNKIIDELILLIKGNGGRKKIFEKQIELQYATQHYNYVAKKREKFLKKILDKLSG